MRIKAMFLVIYCLVACVLKGESSAVELPSDIYVIKIWTNSGMDPSYDLIDPPEGCWAGSITNNFYEEGQMLMMLGPDTLLDTSSFNEERNFRIKVVGNTSTRGSAKKPYKIKLGKKYDLLFREGGQHRNKEWRLSGVGGSSFKTVIGLLVNNEVGMDWTPGFAFANVFINDDYKGLYLLMESVSVGQGRCQVDDTGFLIESDAFYWKDSVYFKTDHQIVPVGYTFKYPDEEKLSEDYVTAVQRYMNMMEAALYEHIGSASDYIDFQSFASWCLGHDILGTYDAGGSNRFLYKQNFSIEKWLPDTSFSTDDNDTIVSQTVNDTTLLSMTSMWDFDSVFGCEGEMSSVHSGISFYFGQLFKDSLFCSVYTSVYERVSNDLFNNVTGALRAINDSIGVSLQYSRRLDEKRWESRLYSINGEITNIENWFAARKKFLDEAILGIVSLPDLYSGCVNVYVQRGIMHVEGDYKKLAVYTIDGRVVRVNDTEKPLEEGVYVVVIDGKAYKVISR